MKIFRKAGKAAGQVFRFILLLGPVFLMCAPIFLLLSGSVMSRQELSQYLAPLFGNAEGYIGWRLFPQYPTGEHYWKLLLYTPQFYTVFWNSLKLVAAILGGQLLIGVPAAWAFAVYRFRGRKFLFLSLIHI